MNNSNPLKFFGSVVGVLWVLGVLAVLGFWGTVLFLLFKTAQHFGIV